MTHERSSIPPHFPFLRPYWFLVAGLSLFLVMGGILFWPHHDASIVEAKSSYLTEFVNSYPHTSNTQLDSCNTCHTNVPDLNSYGRDYRSHGHDFRAIELLDSDGDGYLNIDEINALSFPGDINSTPGTQPTHTPPPSTTPNPPPVDGEYQLIGWNDLGMHCMNESFADLAVLPPYNTLWAQLIRVGPEPEIVTKNVIIEYSFQNNTTSSNKTDFWDYAGQLFGVVLEPDEGLTGARLTGTMHPQGDSFIIEGVPLTPYEDNAPHVQQPYQLADLVAKDATTGEVLARTTFVAPVSTEMHCDDCHGDGMEGIATGKVETNILALHDKEEGTDLMAQRPVLCANCHGSNALGMAGDPNLPSLSHAIHGKHGGDEGDGGDKDCDEDGVNDDCDDSSPSLTLFDGIQKASDAQAECYQCHPGPQTKCLRGTMAAAGMTCQDCHGSMKAVADTNREPWVDLPRCGDCHGDQYAEEPGKLFRQSKGHGGLYCEACHGSPHAILPSTESRDNIQVIRLQGYADTLRECSVCHGNNVPDGPGPHGMVNPNPHPTATPTSPSTTPPPPTPTATLMPTSSPYPTSTPHPTRTPDPTQTPMPTDTPEPTPGPDSLQLWLDPEYRSVGEDDDFTLEMKSMGAGVAGYEITLRFDPSILQAQAAVLGDWLDGSGRTPAPLGPSIDNQHGLIHFGAYSLGSGQPPMSESQLARFTFRSVSKGESLVWFETYKLTDASGQVYANVHTRDARITVQSLDGDLNGDCIVDISDIMMVVAAWGLEEGQPGWDPALDLDDNGVIDISDIMMVVQHWGETCQDADAIPIPNQGNGLGRSRGEDLARVEKSPRMHFAPRNHITTLTSGLVEVQLRASDVKDLASFETKVTFDPDRLQLQEVSLSDWLGSTDRQVIPLGPSVDTVAGSVSLGAVSFGNTSGVDGDGVLATLRFRVLTPGISRLTMSVAKMTDTQGISLNPVTEDGSIMILDRDAIYLPVLR